MLGWFLYESASIKNSATKQTIYNFHIDVIEKWTGRQAAHTCR